MGIRRFIRKSIINDKRIIDELVKEVAATLNASTPDHGDSIHGTHSLVRPREDARFHREILSGTLGQRGLTLEIGPYFSPIVSGKNVRYFDIFDYAELRRRASEDPDPIVTPETVVEVHYTDPNGDLATIPEKFVDIVSSHSIEHQPCLITHLEKVFDLLEDGGRYVAFIPDKRFCFDHFSPYSSVADVLQAASEKRNRHTLASIVHLIGGGTHNDPQRHWKGDHADQDYLSQFTPRVAHALDVFQKAEGDYIDCHAWRFDPDRFAEICKVLFDLGRIRLRLTDIGDTRENSHEFSAVFVK